MCYPSGGSSYICSFSSLFLSLSPTDARLHTQTLSLAILHDLLYSKHYLDKFRIPSGRMTRPYRGLLLGELRLRGIAFGGWLFVFVPDPINHPLREDPGLRCHPVIVLPDSWKTKYLHDPNYFAVLIISHRPRNAIECCPILGSNTVGTQTTGLLLRQFEGLQDNIRFRPYRFDSNTLVGLRNPLVIHAACLHCIRGPSPAKIDRRSLIALIERLSELRSAGFRRTQPQAQRNQRQSHRVNNMEAVSQPPVRFQRYNAGASSLQAQRVTP